MLPGKQWEFKTARFRVALYVEPEYDYRYDGDDGDDGDDEDGETQAKLNSGEYVAFCSTVVVYCDGRKLAQDSLGGSVYSADEVSDFWMAHRTSSSAYRNTLEQKAQHRAICHYFPSMVNEAIREARKAICTAPKLRCMGDNQ